ncbi:lactonase family protein [Chthonomonas calidirosea]|uniref:lactonase family protein n=1 Tax=Chthonomonas calidirosea TaxID=454171 RepID=UPI0006ECC320|nr:lactonase family protein [Chthonomonas calidirosea]CEK18672.1 6-phosphogluconolactonase [Chthonomonas calidirosea]
MMRIYVGTYSGQIGLLELSEAGKITAQRSIAGPEAPAFLCLHPNKQTLYALSETRPGRITAYTLEPATGELRFKNDQALSGAYTCHLSVDPMGRMLFAASYGSGHVHLLPLAADGALLPEAASIHHEGRGAHPDRQEGPHVHCTVPHPQQPYLFVADLGVDRVFVYRIDRQKALLEPHSQATLPVGAGPRHIAIHPNGRFLYVINELNSTVTHFLFDAEKGVLLPTNTHPTIPSSHVGENYPSEVALSPDGRFLYGANRGHNSLAVFQIEEATGQLSPLGHVAVEGDWPRHFAISPDGRWLVVANQKSNNVVFFHRDRETGMPQPLNRHVALAAPSCILFLSLESNGDIAAG